MTPVGSQLLVLDSLRAGRFESAWDLMQADGISKDKLDLSDILEDLQGQISCESAKGDLRAVHRLNRRIRSLNAFRSHGFVPQKLIAPVDLPEGYQGKILLGRIVGGKAHGLVCLRSGDDWHREILRNTKEEIQDLGFENSDVAPAGGAWVRFEPDHAIVIHGSSSEFGACDKKTAADLVSGAFPGRKVLIR